MEGLSPWELATLKVVYHRSDRGRKGFLNADDIKQLCKDLGVQLSEQESQQLFSEMDVDNDGRISFSELMSHLANNAGHVTDMQLRAAMLNQTALVATGAAIPLILKGKAMIVLGTLFYDPVRLFRDFYVDYFHALKSRRMAGEKIAKEDIKSLFEGIRKGFGAGLRVRTTALVVLAICVDCAVGALVFLIYAQTRSQFQRIAQEKFLKMQNEEEKRANSLRDHHPPRKNDDEAAARISFLNKLPTDHIEHPATLLISACYLQENSLNQTIEEEEKQAHQHQLAQQQQQQQQQEEGKSPAKNDTLPATTFRKRLNRTEVCILEASSGAVAGACAGLLTPVAKRLLSRDLYWPDAGVGGRTLLRIRHGMASHAAFFSGFYFFRSYFAEIAYKRMRFQSTTFADAIVTTLAGCFAGGCWKVASEPLKNRDEWVRTHSWEKWNKMPFATRIAIRTKGLGWQLAQTMPVTGVAFLIYEASFYFFL